jgi:imidazoleglycerol-phosphate dehydratase
VALLFKPLQGKMSSKKSGKRTAKLTRTTKETDIDVDLTLEGSGNGVIATGIPFFDHMLTLMTAHGFFDLTLNARGDIEVDGHHTVEDVGIVLGSAFDKALADKRGVKRYGTGLVPMDESLASVVIDYSNRPFLAYNVQFVRPTTGTFDVELVEEFFKAFVNSSRSSRQRHLWGKHPSRY